jgi:exodeoxyribonuclease V beta subunit
MSTRSRSRTLPLDILAEPLEGLRLIEASAGTGKTHTLADLYLRLLLERDLTVDQILVVTFTVAATAELRDRIRARLETARRAFLRGAPPNPADAVLAGLLARRPERAAAARRLAQAVQGFDEAAILTIHGFCQRVLRESAFDSGQPFEVELVPDEGEILQEVVDDFWRRRFYDGPRLLVGDLVGRGWTPESLVKAVRPYLRRPPCVVRPPVPPTGAPEADSRYEACYREARAAWQADRAAIETLLFGQRSLNATKYPPSALPGWLEEVDAFFRPTEPHAAWRKRVEKFAAGALRAAVKKGGTPPAHPAFGACERLVEARQALTAVLDFRAKTLRLELLEYCRQELAARKKRRQLIAYQDLLLRLEQALASPHGATLAASLRRRYAAALIDEFQDTDPVQYTIFKRVYGGSGLPVFLVGDPKQAIFGFRGADVFSYLAAGRDAGARRTLERNWRSAPGLVQAVNALFGGVAQPFLLDEIAFHPVRPAEKERRAFAVAGDDTAPLRFWCLPRADDHEPLPKGRAADAAIQATADEIARLLAAADRGEARIGETALRGGDIAVLVRTNIQADRIREALLARGIASVQLGEASVFASHEADEIQRVLLAAAQPAREAVVRAALTTDLFGVCGNALESLGEDEAAWEARANAFLEYHTTWREQGFVQMFRRLMKAEGVAARLLRFADGERRLTNVLHLAELLQAAAAADHLGMEGVIAWLSTRRQREETTPEEAQLRLESDENLVKIATIHKSKGLQYPLVFCPFLWDVPLRKQDEDLGILFHDPTAADQLTLDAGSERIGEARALAEREALAEHLRLAYVAVTRAEHRCTVVWGNVNGGEASGLAYLLHEPADLAPGADRAAAVRERTRALGDHEVLADLAALAERAGGTIAVERLAPAALPAAGLTAAVPEPLHARPFTGTIPRGWQVTSFSGLTAGAHREAWDYDAAPAPERGGRLLLPGQPPADIADFPRGVRAGIFIHALFASLDFARADRAAVEAATARALREHGFDAAWQPAVADMVERVVRTPLDPASGLALSHVAREARRDEMVFHYPVAHLDPRELTRVLRTQRRDRDGAGPIAEIAFDPVRGYMTGSMDLVFEAGGRYYLADYKSNWLGDGPDAYRAERLPPVMARETYDLQYLIYTVALARYLARRLPDFRYARDFGGVFYLFVRGMEPARGADFGVYRDRPSEESMEALDRYLARGETA